jgi:hypothetical protein
VDVHNKIDELVALVESARSMPMSASCIVNRPELLALVDELRQLLPEELDQAEAIIREREAYIEEGRQEAEGIIAAAKEEHARLVSASEVTVMAKVKAEEIRAAAREEARAIRVEVDDYVDSKLANFEVALNKTIAAVQRGREKLRGRGDLEDLDTEGAQPLPPI